MLGVPLPERHPKLNFESDCLPAEAIRRWQQKGSTRCGGTYLGRQLAARGTITIGTEPWHLQLYQGLVLRAQHSRLLWI